MLITQEKLYAIDAVIMHQRENLLLLTDHEFNDIEKDGHYISIRPVYEWSVTVFIE